MSPQFHALADLLAPPGMIHAVAEHLWQSTLFAGVVWLVTLVLRRNRAAARHGLWLAASVKFLAPFSLVIAIASQIGWHKASAPARRHAPSAMEEISQPFTVLAPAPLLASVPRAPSRIPAVLFGVWLCGFLANLLAWWRRWRRVRSALRAASPLPLELPIPVRSGPARLEPGVFGVLRPLLLLPEGITQRLTPAQLEAVIAHELCHVRRRDNLTAAIHMVVEALFWFHPLVWWMEARLVEERERACDEEVLRMPGDPQDYAEGIVTVCKFYLESPLACVPGVTGSNLKQRVEAIMENRHTHKLNFSKKALLAAVGIAAIVVPIVTGQTQTPSSEKRVEFEVASIHPAIDDGGHDSDANGSLFQIHNYTLKRLIASAYEIDMRQIYGGPNWVDSNSYDITAKIPGEFVQQTRDKLPRMIQSLLADRFQLVIHREPRQISGYELVVAKKGSKMEQAKADDQGSHLNGNNSHLKAENVTMENFARSLSRNRDIGELVVDKTGLTGGFNFTLDWMPEPHGPNQEPSADDRPSIFTALQDQLGLKLESAKVPMQAIVIDRAVKPSEN